MEMKPGANSAVEMFNRHEAMIARLTGHIAGLNKAIDLLIVTHPDPQGVRATWQANLPRQVDMDMEDPTYAQAPFREGLQAAMALVSRSCEGAGAR